MIDMTLTEAETEQALWAAQAKIQADRQFMVQSRIERIILDNEEFETRIGELQEMKQKNLNTLERIAKADVPTLNLLYKQATNPQYGGLHSNTTRST